MDFFSRFFTSMFRSSANRYKTRLTAQARRATVGRVQAKAMGTMAALDQKAFKATDKLTGFEKRKDQSAAELQKQSQAAKAGTAGGGGGGGGGARPAGGGAGGGGGARPAGGGGGAAAGGGGGGGFAGGGGQRRGNAGQVANQQQGSAKMGKGKRNKRQQALAISCTNCGSSLQPDWDMCPFCGTPVGQYGGPSAPQGMMMNGAPQPQESGEKTVAINLDALNIDNRRTVVGWIVAQNGNHRGEDFRIYDGKNILGTAADCDIVITDPFLSAKHCTIRHENGNFYVQDLDSMNGTFVNQKRCTKADLIDNDTIRLGRTEFKFKSLF